MDAKVFNLLEIARLPIQNVANYMGHTDIQMTADYSYAGVEEQKAAFKVSNGQPVEVAPPAPAPASSGKLDAAVTALTAAYSRGDLSAEAFAAAVTALNSNI